MPKSYTENELRDILDARAPQIMKGVFDRLEDDNFFKAHNFQFTFQSQKDGSFFVSDSNFVEIFEESFRLFIGEFLSELMVTLFEEETT